MICGRVGPGDIGAGEVADGDIAGVGDAIGFKIADMKIPLVIFKVKSLFILLYVISLI